MEQFGMLNPQTQQLTVGIGGAVILALQLTAVVGLWLQRRKVRNLDGRVAHLAAAMALLTDTLEGGLHDVAREVSRLGTQPSAAPVVPRNRTAAQRRVRGAAKRGRSVRDVERLRGGGRGCRPGSLDPSIRRSRTMDASAPAPPGAAPSLLVDPRPCRGCGGESA